MHIVTLMFRSVAVETGECVLIERKAVLMAVMKELRTVFRYINSV